MLVLKQAVSKKIYITKPFSLAMTMTGHCAIEADKWLATLPQSGAMTTQRLVIGMSGRCCCSLLLLTSFSFKQDSRNFRPACQCKRDPLHSMKTNARWPHTWRPRSNIANRRMFADLAWTYAPFHMSFGSKCSRRCTVHGASSKKRLRLRLMSESLASPA